LARGDAAVMTVACHPVANCSDRTSVAGRAVVTRTVSSPHGVLDTTWTRLFAPPWTQARPAADGWVKIEKGPIMPRYRQRAEVTASRNAPSTR
jgi:hypothetical protein